MKKPIHKLMMRCCITLITALGFLSCEKSDYSLIEAQKGSITVDITDDNGDVITDSSTPISVTSDDYFTMNLGQTSSYQDDDGTVYSVDSKTSIAVAVNLSDVGATSTDNLYSYSMSENTTTTDGNPSVVITEYTFKIGTQSVIFTTTTEQYSYTNSSNKTITMPYIGVNTPTLESNETKSSGAITVTKVEATRSSSSLTEEYSVVATFEVTTEGINTTDDIGDTFTFEVEYNAIIASTNSIFIYNTEELLDFALLVNGGLTYLDAILMSDLDLIDVEWTPIGTPLTNHYTGSFDGYSHTISNLTINDTTIYAMGLFGVIEDGKISNLTIKNPQITNSIPYDYIDRYSGAVCGFAIGNSQISNCSVIGGSISGYGTVGGIIGWVARYDNTSSSTISKCYNYSCEISGECYIGGVIGIASYATVSECYNSGDILGVTMLGGVIHEIGGIIGYAYNTTISECHNSGEISGDSYVGGLCGTLDNYGKISNCSNTGDISGGNSNNSAGGIIGQAKNGVDIYNCNNSGEVSGYAQIGGVVGTAYNGATWTGGGVTIYDCYNTGEVSGELQVGGVVGASTDAIINADNTNAVIHDCYNTGKVSGDGSLGWYIGGVIGYTLGDVYNCYNTGYVSGNDFVGGIAGYISSDISFTNNTNSGSVSCTSNNVGDIYGYEAN